MLKSPNPQMCFALEGMVELTAWQRIGSVPSDEVLHAGYCEMFSYASRFLQRYGGRSAAAGEAVSLALIDIGVSRITETYKPHPLGIRPWVCTILRCRSRDVIHQHFAHESTPEFFDVTCGKLRPDQVVAMADLIVRVCSRIRLEELTNLNECKESVGTLNAQYIRKSRRRKHIWMKVEDLFPDTKFKPNVKKKVKPD